MVVQPPERQARGGIREAKRRTPHPRKPPRTSLHYGTEGFKEGLELGPIIPRSNSEVVAGVSRPDRSMPIRMMPLNFAAIRSGH